MSIPTSLTRGESAFAKNVELEFAAQETVKINKKLPKVYRSIDF